MDWYTLSAGANMEFTPLSWSPDSFEVVGYGCMTCIGNSGPLPEPVVEAITQVPQGALIHR